MPDAAAAFDEELSQVPGSAADVENASSLERETQARKVLEASAVDLARCVGLERLLVAPRGKGFCCDWPVRDWSQDLGGTLYAVTPPKSTNHANPLR